MKKPPEIAKRNDRIAKMRSVCDLAFGETFSLVSSIFISPELARISVAVRYQCARNTNFISCGSPTVIFRFLVTECPRLAFLWLRPPMPGPRQLEASAAIVFHLH